jgi:hypothetical protein
MNEDRPTNSVARQVAVPGNPVVDPADWQAEDLSRRDDWLVRLEDAELAELMEMSAGIRKIIGDDPNGLLALGRDAFDLGAFSAKVGQVWNSLRDGVGISLIRGLPMADIELIDAAVIYWAIGRHLGNAQSNNPDGDVFGHITDLGKDYGDAAVRGYQTRVTMDYHCDQSSIVDLLCVRQAMSGGKSKITSAIRVYNELLARRPDLVSVLMEPMCWTKHGEKDAGEANYYESPVFSFLDDYLCTSFGPMHILKGHALPEAPDMTDMQREAVRVTEDLAEELHFSTRLEPGDIFLANNFVVFHTRNAFDDWPEPERKRLLWRLWLVNDDLRPPTDYSKQWRRGVKLSSTRERIVLS